MSYRKRKASRDSRINRITACGQHVRPYLARDPLLRGDHPTV